MRVTPASMEDESIVGGIFAISAVISKMLEALRLRRS